jgi:hypothetical protein
MTRARPKPRESERDKRINAALKLLAPPAGQRGQCRKHIDVQLIIGDGKIGAAQADKGFGSKKGRKKLKQIRDAHRRVRAIYDGFDDPEMKRMFFLSESAFALIDETMTITDREIAKAEGLLANSSSRETAFSKRAAVAAAYNLLVKWKAEPVATRGMDWDQLSAALTGTWDKLGSKNCGFFDLMRAFKNGRNSVTK